MPALTSASAVRQFINSRGKWGSGVSSACSHQLSGFRPVRVEEACIEALTLGVLAYHFVRRYLEREPTLPLTLQQVDRLIRELQQYRDVIQLRIKESEAT